MVDFVQLQEILKERLEQDRAIHMIEVTGPTLEAVTADAARPSGCSDSPP